VPATPPAPRRCGNSSKRTLVATGAGCGGGGADGEGCWKKGARHSHRRCRLAASSSHARLHPDENAPLWRRRRLGECHHSCTRGAPAARRWLAGSNPPRFPPSCMVSLVTLVEPFLDPRAAAADHRTISSLRARTMVPPHDLTYAHAHCCRPARQTEVVDTPFHRSSSSNSSNRNSGRSDRELWSELRRQRASWRRWRQRAASDRP